MTGAAEIANGAVAASAGEEFKVQRGGGLAPESLQELNRAEDWRSAVSVLVTAGVIGMHWTMRDDSFETTVMRLPAWAITSIGSVMAFAIIFTQGTSNAFIYFQF